MKKWVKIAMGMITMVIIIGLGGLSISLNMAKNDLEAQYDGAVRKSALLSKKVQEEKSKAGALMHKSRAAESQLSGLRTEVASWQDKYQALTSDYQKLQADTAGKQKACSDQVNTWSAKYAEMDRQRQRAEKNYQDAIEKIAEKAKEVASAEQTIASLDARLRRSDIKLNHCEEKNDVLYDVADSLLDKFENQSMLSGILKSETFVQLKRVELEKIVQDYEDKIEAAHVGNISQAPFHH